MTPALRRLISRKRTFRPVRTFLFDTFETYGDGSQLSGLDDGTNGSNPTIQWVTPYKAGTNFMDFQAYDTFESYADGADLDGLNSGTNVLGSWNSAYRGL